MILVLDACTISNLVHVFQNDTLLKALPQAFDKIIVASEVIAEVVDTKDDYRTYYTGRWDELEAIYDGINLADFLSPDDASKFECKPSLVKYFAFKGFAFKSNGEFFSSLLSLYISRVGGEYFSDDVNKILFATDDAKAEEVYQSFFDCNRIGAIISSIDVVVILYLKSLITKTALLTYIEGLYPLYSRELNQFKNQLKKDLAKETDPTIRLGLSTLDEYLSNGEFEELLDTVNSPQFRKTFKKHNHLKENIASIPVKKFREKMKLLKEKHDELKRDLVWKV